MRLGIVSAVVGVAVALAATGCAPQGVVRRQPTPAEPMVQVAAAAEIPARADGSRYEQDPQAAAIRDAIGRLGIDLLRDIRAGGETLAEMRRTLHTGAIAPADADRVYADYLAWIPTAAQRGPDADTKGTALELSVANAIWLAPDFVVKQPFLDRSRDWYGAQIALLDMAAREAPDVVNAWVSSRTHGKIPRIIDTLPEATKAVLADAVYLKGSWSTPFERDRTEQAAFRLADGTSPRLPTMSGSIEGAYRETDVYQATERRMLGGAMYIYLPRPGKTPDDVLASLAEERANGSAPAWEDDRHGELFLPRFKLAWSDSLARPLKRLGMPLAFDPREADFTALSDTPVWIDDVVHAATTEVDETGIEAAAATVVVMRATAAAPSPKPPVEMRVDRPFVYEVVSGGMPLFIGVVEDPR